MHMYVCVCVLFGCKVLSLGNEMRGFFLFYFYFWNIQRERESEREIKIWNMMMTILLFLKKFEKNKNNNNNNLKKKWILCNYYDYFYCYYYSYDPYFHILWLNFEENFSLYLFCMFRIWNKLQVTLRIMFRNFCARQKN